MLILACDTSNSTCCAGLFEDGKQIAYELSLEKKTHSETFMPLVHRVMEKSGYDHFELDAYAAVTGPGSFTGIRIGLAAVKGMAVASGKKCIAVDSTEALARSVDPAGTSDIDRTIFVSAFDARNNRVFAACYAADGMKQILSTEACDSTEFAQKILALPDIMNKHIIVMGDGCTAMRRGFLNSVGKLEGHENEKFEAGVSLPVTSISELPFTEYAPGTAIMPKGIAAAAFARIEKEGDSCLVDPDYLNAGYFAQSSADRLKK